MNKEKSNRRSLPGTMAKQAIVGAVSVALVAPSWAAVPLADQPIFTNNGVPGNLALALSVEFPTAISVAHVGDIYTTSDEYVGIFDVDKCYDYKAYATETAAEKSHFFPVGNATSHECAGKWSGNLLNWMSMQTIDTFRTVLTGGYRAVDTPNLTILEKAWSSSDGSDNNFPIRNVTYAAARTGTPFSRAISAKVRTLGNAMEVTTDLANVLKAEFFNNYNLTGSPTYVEEPLASAVNNWHGGSPRPGINADQFSVRLTGTNTAPVTGTYYFQTESDDGIKFYLDGVLKTPSSSWNDRSATLDPEVSVFMTAGQQYTVKIEYRENGGDAVLNFKWKPPTATTYSDFVASSGNSKLTYSVRARVCDATPGAGDLEDNCVAYPSGYYKPEGLMQKYAKQIRYSAFGYLSDNNLYRDGGVLRARQKFVGPTMPKIGAADVTNPNAEWSASDGVMIINPDKTDADTTSLDFGLTSSADKIVNSGAMNYLNKFGSVITNNYKSYDPVSELYYAIVRYFKNQGNVPEWSAVGSASSSTAKKWADGFPVIQTWDDPMLYACQRNFVLGIGDVNTHADKNLPGPTTGTKEPAKPKTVSPGDNTIDVVAATNAAGALEGITNLASESHNNDGGSLMVGLAYDANTSDIRPDLQGKQTVQTYWMDVLEYGNYKKNNQYYLATKYGGFTVPDTFDWKTRTTPLDENWWYTNKELAYSPANPGNNQKRPDNYFVAARPDQVVDGLTRAFASIASKLDAYTTSFATSLPQVSTAGTASYSAQYSAKNGWTGEVKASTIDFSGPTPTLTDAWKFTDKLAIQLNNTGWDTDRRIATWNGSAGVKFRAAALPSAQLALLDTSYVANNDSANYLKYLRGDTTQEVANGGKYRDRAKLVGDIVGSRARPISAPELPFSDAANPGYGAFKSTWKTNPRPTMVYVGANDGMMHAINGELTGADAGREVFAYIPSALFAGPNSTPSVDGLAALGNTSFIHHQYVNATPNVFDIDLGNTQGSSGTNWKSVLIGGLGKGGKAYYALDVTDPASMTTEDIVASKVMWEFSDQYLGYTFGEPVIVKTKRYGWTMIVPSGYNNVDGKGYFFVVNPRTGALLQRISTGEGSLSTPAGLAQADAYVLDRTDGYADAVYAGDLLGNVWRLDVSGSGSYSAPTKIATLKTSAGVAQPITSRPLIEVNPDTNERWVFVGTGRLLDSTDIASTQMQSFYAFRDGTAVKFAGTAPAGTSYPFSRSQGNFLANSDLLVGVSYTDKKQQGWVFDLGADATTGSGWRVVSDPVSFQTTVAFATMLPLVDACEPSGTSRVYAVDFMTGKTKLSESVNGVDTAVAYSKVEKGVVTDLSFMSVAGEGQLITGTDQGELKRVGTFSDSRSTRRLNWRELPVAD